MTKRTTIEIDQDLLERARQALGQTTARATVERALRLAAENAESARDERADRQRRYLERLGQRVDADVLVGEDMWR